MPFTVIMIVALVIPAGITCSYYQAYRRRRKLEQTRALSPCQRQILIESAHIGEVRVVTSGGAGFWIRAGMSDFFDATNQTDKRDYEKAFNGLVQLELLRHEQGNLYRLTETGQETANELAGKPPPTPIDGSWDL